MKHWHETSQLLSRAARLAATGRQAAIATVIRIEGSAYRRPGAKMLVADDGTLSGSVSGGCLEADVREVALGVIRTGVPRLLHYDTGADEATVWGLGLGCYGSVDIFVQPATSESALEAAAKVRDLLQGEAPFTVSSVIAGSVGVGRFLVSGPGGVVAGSTGDRFLDRQVAARATGLIAEGESLVYDVAASQVFTEVLRPPPDLLICGAGDDAIPLAGYACDSGFRVSVLDHRPAYLASDRFPEGTRLVQARPEDGFGKLPLGPRSYAVVMTHSLAKDREWVRQLLGSEVSYVGVLGPRARTEEMLRHLGALGDHRVFGPVGLDLGAEGAEQVALSIVAELLAVWSGREPRHLRAREGAIHAG